jgi:hypothetical protein
MTSPSHRFSVGARVLVSATRWDGRRIVHANPKTGTVRAMSGADDGLMIIVFDPTHSSTSTWAYALPEDCEAVP